MARTKKAAKAFKRKPRVEYVEIGSDEVREQEAARRLRGPLRGLNPDNVLSTPPVQTSTELPDDSNVDENGRKPTPATNSTRALRHVKVEKERYDMKYHMMDEVTRPKRAAKRRFGSRSLVPESDSDGESQQTTLCNSDSDDDSSSSSEATAVPSMTQRAPDPNATRFSKRSEAHKAVNYNRKHHPQDYGLPGYHKNSKNVSASFPPLARKRPMPVHDEDVHSDCVKQSRQPRKKLKSLSSDALQQSTAQARVSKPVPAGRSKHSQGAVALSDATDIEDFVTEMIRRSQAPAMRVDQAAEATNGEISGNASQSAQHSSPLPAFDHWSANEDQTNDLIPVDAGSCPTTTTAQVVRKGMASALEARFEHTASNDFDLANSPERSAGVPRTSSHTSGRTSSYVTARMSHRTSSHTLGRSSLAPRTSSHTLGRSSLPPRVSSHTLRQLTASSAVPAAHCPSSFFEEALEVMERPAHLIEELD